VETPAAAPKLDVVPASEPLPPAPAPSPAPAATVQPAAPKPEVRPTEVKGPDISPVNLANIKLHAPEAAPAEPQAEAATPSTPPVSPLLPVSPAPAAAQPEPSAPAATVAPTPPATGPAPAPVPPTPPTPVAAAKVGEPEPVALKVLSLTGTPGMVQWQLDGGTQWLIPELEENTRAKFVVRTGPDAGGEFLLNDTVRVRLGRFSRAELRLIDTADEAGSGKRLNVSLLRGVIYVVPTKGSTVSVQTPQRTVVVKEPTQITHDNGGTRSVSFTDQPNPGSTAGVPSANP